MPLQTFNYTTEVQPEEFALKGIPYRCVHYVQLQPFLYLKQKVAVHPFELLSYSFNHCSYHLDNVPSPYVRFSMALDVRQLPLTERFYLELLATNWQKSPLRIDGEVRKRMNENDWT